MTQDRVWELRRYGGWTQGTDRLHRTQQGLLESGRHQEGGVLSFPPQSRQITVQWGPHGPGNTGWETAADAEVSAGRGPVTA